MAKVPRDTRAIHGGMEDGLAVWGSRVIVAVISIEADTEVAMVVQLP